MAVAAVKRPRGRPRKVVSVDTKTDTNLLQKMIEQQAEQQKFQNSLMLEMMRVAQNNAEMLREWFKMFQAPNSITPSTSLNDREMDRDEEWQPLKPNQVAAMLGHEEEEYFKTMVNN